VEITFCDHLSLGFIPILFLNPFYYIFYSSYNFFFIIFILEPHLPWFVPISGCSFSYFIPVRYLLQLLLGLLLFHIHTKTNFVAFSPRANYTDWATATWRNLVPTFMDRGVSRGQRSRSPTVINLSCLDRSHSYSSCNKSFLKPHPIFLQLIAFCPWVIYSVLLVNVFNMIILFLSIIVLFSSNLAWFIHILKHDTSYIF
jgi:hypothetical protein